MPKVLALCVVYALERYGYAGSPGAGVFPGKAASYGVGLFHLVSGGEFQHVHGVEAGVGEHGSHHLGTVGKVKAEVPGKVKVVVGRNRLGVGHSVPNCLSHGGGAEISGSELSAYVGIGLLAGSGALGRSGNVSAFFPEILGVGGLSAENNAQACNQ